MRGHMQVAAAVAVVGLAVAVGVSGASGSASSVKGRWVIRDLGTLGGVYGAAVDVNDRGQIVGTSLTRNAQSHPFLWQNGKMIDLGARGGLPTGTSVVAINERGQVIGNEQRWVTTGNTEGLAASAAILWENGRVTRLTPIAGRDLVQAVAINDRGQVIGVSSTRGGSQHGFFWDKGHMTDLGKYYLPAAIDNQGRVVGNADGFAFLWQNGKMTNLAKTAAHSNAWAINERGQIVGSITLHSPINHASLWQNGKTTDLGTLGSDESDAFLINDRGEIVGSSYIKKVPPRQLHYFVWQSGNMTDLGAFEVASTAPSLSSIFSMNDRGQIVWTTFGAYAVEHGLVWENGRLTQLPTLGGKITEARAINNRGQIVGTSQIKGGKEAHVVMWTLRSGG